MDTDSATVCGERSPITWTAVVAESEREIGSHPSAIDESSPLKELDASPPTLEVFDELRRLTKGLLDDYLLDPSYLPTAQPERQKAETLGDQIDRLREECRLTVEELAENLNIESRSVYRHLSGEAITSHWPHLRVRKSLLKTPWKESTYRKKVRQTSVKR